MYLSNKMAESVNFPKKTQPDKNHPLAQAHSSARVNRRKLLALALYGLVSRAQANGASTKSFKDFVAEIWPAAQQAGIAKPIFDTVAAGLTPEPGILNKPQSQAEFTIAIPAYVASVLTPSRISRGREAASELDGALARASQRHGVPGEIIIAILGIESNYGVSTGSADIFRVLATLAWSGHRSEIFLSEFIAALTILQNGDASRSELRGSWAGAMGQPQFMPSAYLKYAESNEGGHAPDIWRSKEDTIASVANFLEKSGWRADLPAVVEARLPENYDYAAIDLDFSQWRSLGVTQANGESLPKSGAASLYFPAGALGPCFLISENFEVIRKYNMSDAYALSVTLLAERIASRSMPTTPWPRVTPLSTNEVKSLQHLLAGRGYYRGAFDGKLGRSSRNAIHAAQIDQGWLPADGFATRALLAKLRAR